MTPGQGIGQHRSILYLPLSVYLEQDLKFLGMLSFSQMVGRWDTVIALPTWELLLRTIETLDVEKH